MLLSQKILLSLLFGMMGATTALSGSSFADRITHSECCINNAPVASVHPRHIHEIKLQPVSVIFPLMVFAEAPVDNLTQQQGHGDYPELKIQQLEGPFVFATQTGEHVSYRHLLATMACDTVSVEHRGLHALRHSFALSLYARGVEVKIIPRFLGHTSEITYNRYIHFFERGHR